MPETHEIFTKINMEEALLLVKVYPKDGRKVSIEKQSAKIIIETKKGDVK